MCPAKLARSNRVQTVARPGGGGAREGRALGAGPQGRAAPDHTNAACWCRWGRRPARGRPPGSRGGGAPTAGTRRGLPSGMARCPGHVAGGARRGRGRGGMGTPHVPPIAGRRFGSRPCAPHAPSPSSPSWRPSWRGSCRPWRPSWGPWLLLLAAAGTGRRGRVCGGRSTQGAVTRRRRVGSCPCAAQLKPAASWRRSTQSRSHAWLLSSGLSQHNIPTARAACKGIQSPHTPPLLPTRSPSLPAVPTAPQQQAGQPSEAAEGGAAGAGSRHGRPARQCRSEGPDAHRAHRRPLPHPRAGPG